MKENNKNIGLIIFLTVLVTALISFIVFDKVFYNKKEEINTEQKDITENTQEIEKKEDYTFDNMEGTYKFNGSNGISYELILNSDGLFSYRFIAGGYNTIIGNYIIKENKIILNYLFQDVVNILVRKQGTSILDIVSNNEIKDNNGHILDDISSNTTYILKKDDNAELFSIIDGFNGDHIGFALSENMLP